jgi:hypothetical protein
MAPVRRSDVAVVRIAATPYPARETQSQTMASSAPMQAPTKGRWAEDQRHSAAE